MSPSRKTLIAFLKAMEFNTHHQARGGAFRRRRSGSIERHRCRTAGAKPVLPPAEPAVAAGSTKARAPGAVMDRGAFDEADRSRRL